MVHLFCYGTLKSDGRANRYLRGGKLIGAAKTKAEFTLHSVGWFPVMIPAKDGNAIEGELWEIPENAISLIDQYEGGGFHKSTIELQEPHAEKTVLTYLYKGRVDDLPDIGHRWEN